MFLNRIKFSPNFVFFENPRKILAILFFAALIIRLFYVSQINIKPWCDMALYDACALDIIDNGVLNATDELIIEPPVYPLFLAGIFYIFGHNYLVVRLIQALLSAFICILIYLIAKNIFNKKIGLTSCLISVLYFDFFSYAGILMAETLSLFIFTLLIYLILLNDRKYILCGILSGILILTKAVYMIMLPPLCVWMWIKFRDGKKIFQFVFFTFLIILPWTIRNYFVYKKFVLVCAVAGQGAYIRHNPVADGGPNFDFQFHQDGKFLVDESLPWLERNKIAGKKAFEFAISHPFKELQLVFIGLYRYWGLNSHFSFYAKKYPLQRLFFYAMIIINGVIYPLCFLGIAFSMGNKNAQLLTYIIFTFTFCFITIFPATRRLHFPLVPFVIIFSSFGILILPNIIGKMRAKKLKEISGKVLPVLFFTTYMCIGFLIHFISRYKAVLKILD